MAGQKYKVSFSVDGRRTEQVVVANSSYDAKKLIEAQYPSSKIIFWSVTQIR